MAILKRRGYNWYFTFASGQAYSNTSTASKNQTFLVFEWHRIFSGIFFLWADYPLYIHFVKNKLVPWIKSFTFFSWRGASTNSISSRYVVFPIDWDEFLMVFTISLMTAAKLTAIAAEMWPFAGVFFLDCHFPSRISLIAATRFLANRFPSIKMTAAFKDNRQPKYRLRRFQMPHIIFCFESSSTKAYEFDTHSRGYCNRIEPAQNQTDAYAQ